MQDVFFCVTKYQIKNCSFFVITDCSLNVLFTKVIFPHK